MYILFYIFFFLINKNQILMIKFLQKKKNYLHHTKERIPNMQIIASDHLYFPNFYPIICFIWIMSEYFESTWIFSVFHILFPFGKKSLLYVIIQSESVRKWEFLIWSEFSFYDFKHHKTSWWIKIISIILFFPNKFKFIKCNMMPDSWDKWNKMCFFIRLNENEKKNKYNEKNQSIRDIKFKKKKHSSKQIMNEECDWKWRMENERSKW